jgi:hypothetical protein
MTRGPLRTPFIFGTAFNRRTKMRWRTSPSSTGTATRLTSFPVAERSVPHLSARGGALLRGSFPTFGSVQRADHRAAGQETLSEIRFWFSIHSDGGKASDRPPQMVRPTVRALRGGKTDSLIICEITGRRSHPGRRLKPVVVKRVGDHPKSPSGSKGDHEEPRQNSHDDTHVRALHLNPGKIPTLQFDKLRGFPGRSGGFSVSPKARRGR